MKHGDMIIWATADFETLELREGIITKLSNDSVWINNNHKPEDCIYRAYVWPIAAKERLIAAITERKAKRKEYDDTMKLFYQLRNDIVNGVIK